MRAGGRGLEGGGDPVERGAGLGAGRVLPVGGKRGIGEALEGFVSLHARLLGLALGRRLAALFRAADRPALTRSWKPPARIASIAAAVTPR